MLKPPLDEIDLRILRILQGDARIANVALADKVGLSPSPCLRRVRLLEESGVIRGYVAQLDRQKVGLGLTVFVAINLENHAHDESEAFKEAVCAMPEVVGFYVTSGDHDFLLHVVTADLESYREFALNRLLSLPGVLHIKSSFALQMIKDAGALPLSHLEAKY